MMTRKLFVSMGLALLLAAAVLTGCGGKKDTASGETTAGTKTPITFTFYNDELTQDLPFTDPVAKKIQEATGVTLNVTHPVGGDTSAVSLMLASGDLPDFIYSRTPGLNAFLDAQSVIPLDDLIEQYGPNIKKLYGPYFSHLRYSTKDPTIYQFPAYDVRQAFWQTDGIMQVQHAVLKELGYPRMESLTDVEAALKAYYRAHPTIDGQPTLPISLPFDGYGWLFSIGNTGGFMAGWPDDGEYYVDQETLETTFKWIMPEMKAYPKWLNKMYNEGLLDQETFTQTNDTFLAKVAAGRVLSIALPRWYYASAVATLMGDGKPERTYAYLPIVNDPSIKSRLMVDYGFAGGWGIMITTKCKDPARVVEFFNYMSSEEAQILVNWGIEGENYDIIDGKRVLQADDWQGMQSDPDYSKKTGVASAGFGGSSGWQYPFPEYGAAYIDSTGNYITPISPETVRAQYTPIERETLAAYGKEMWTDFFLKPDEMPVQRHGRAFEFALSPDTNALFTQLYDTIANHLGKILMAKPGDFDAAWDAMIKEMYEVGVEKVNAEMTALIKDKVTLWESN
jgi:putative aldouronate transport system substrate-binding protein